LNKCGLDTRLPGTDKRADNTLIVCTDRLEHG
jgi:hypothetical protein